MAAGAYVGIGQNTKRFEHGSSHLLGVSTMGLTFAGLRALGPTVVSVSITSTVLVPSSARSATTDSA